LGLSGTKLAILFKFFPKIMGLLLFKRPSIEPLFFEKVRRFYSKKLA
jgi:hypothetical protein